MSLLPNLQDISDGLAGQSAQDDAQKGQIVTLQAQLAAAQAQVASLQNTITALQLDDSTAQAMVAKLTPQLAAAEAQVASLTAALAASKPAKIFTRLERNTWLIAPGTAANSGSVGNTAGISITPPTDKFSLVTITPAGPYADKYAYQVLGPDPTLIRFRQYGSIYFPTAADAAASQCWESDLPQKVVLPDARYYFDWGMQYDFTENMLRVWNKAAGSWVATGKPMARFAPGTWVDHVIDCHREGNSVIYDQLNVGGQDMLADVIDFPALLLPPSDTSPDILDYGIQPDGNKTGTAYSVAIDNFGLLAWTA